MRIEVTRPGGHEVSVYVKSDILLLYITDFMILGGFDVHKFWELLKKYVYVFKGYITILFKFEVS